MIHKAIVTWLVMIPVGILNGVVRQAVVEPLLGDLRSHQVSVATGSSSFFALIYAMTRREAPGEPDRRLLSIGLGWVLATVAFEFSFGHYVAGDSWSTLAADYNVFAGRLWTVVLAVVAIAPLAVKRIAIHRHDVRRGGGQRLASHA
jgi:hypothetical protein